MRVTEVQFRWIKDRIFKKLLKRDAWENVYVPYQYVFDFMPGHLKGTAKQVLEQLVREDFLLLHKGGVCVSLNSRRMDKIWDYVKTYNRRNV